MKFDYLQRISIYALILLALIDVITNTETHAKSNTKANTKIKASGKLKKGKSESMMEYLNNFYSEKSTMNIESYLAEGSRTQDTNTTNAPIPGAVPSAVSGANPTSASNSTDNTPPDSNGMLQDWFQISSRSFKSRSKFPPVKLLDNTIEIIQTDNLFYRINSAFEKATGGDKGASDLFFWFRLSGLHIYYSSTKSDINVLGAISISSISEVLIMDAEKWLTEEKDTDPKCPKNLENLLYCFTIDDEEHNKWKICSPSQPTARKWVCRINKYLDIDDPACSPKQNNFTTIIEKTVTQPIIILPLPSRECNEDWTYQTNGDDWECDCREGKEQSPIDIPTMDKVTESAVKPLFQYDEVSYKGDLTAAGGKKNLKIEIKENMLRILHPKFGKLVTMDGAVYHAQEIQIHTPAEHTINGKLFDMEVQIVHYGVSKGDLAKQAILCFLIERVPGVYNKLIDDLDFFNLPNQTSRERDLSANIYIPKILYDADDDQIGGMRPFSFYTYQGSLTSPPCSEDTVVYVASQPIPLGSTAIKLFQESVKIPDYVNPQGDLIVSSLLPINNRNAQPLNSRPVFFYDHLIHCGPDPQKPLKHQTGHYEKVQKPIIDYFYVNGEDPSGLPGSFVVSESEAKGTKLNLPSNREEIETTSSQGRDKHRQNKNHDLLHH